MKSVHRLAWIMLGAILLMASLSGCQPVTEPPSEYPPSTPTLQVDLPFFFVQTIAAGNEIGYHTNRIIIHSKVANKNNFWFGVSQKKADMSECWAYQQSVLSECMESDIERVYLAQKEPSPITILFFAIATKTEKEALIIMDVRIDNPRDSVDGFRYALMFDNGEWHVKSWEQVY